MADQGRFYSNETGSGYINDAPFTPGEGQPNQPAAGLLNTPQWKVPIVSQFQYPPGLLAQIAQSQQPMQYGRQFSRYNFGTPQGQRPPGVQNYAPQQQGGQMGGLLGQLMQLLGRR